MFKKSLLALFVLLSSVAMVSAGNRKYTAPVSQTGQTAYTFDFAGVDIATIAFSSVNVLLFSGEGVIVGFVASSNAVTTNYIAFRDTDSVINTATGDTGDYLEKDEIARVYLSSGGAGGTVSNLTPGTSYKFPAAIRVKKGATARNTNNTGQVTTYLFHKFGSGNR